MDSIRMVMYSWVLLASTMSHITILLLYSLVWESVHLVLLGVLRDNELLSRIPMDIIT